MSRTAAPSLNPPFRADHIGSLKRPTAFLKIRDAFDRGECSREELRGAEDAAIRAIVDVQRAAGIRSITDGEFRRCVRASLAHTTRYGTDAQMCCRRMFFEGVFDKLEGFKFVPNCRNPLSHLTMSI
jgi:hypothetical protein